MSQKLKDLILAAIRPSRGNPDVKLVKKYEGGTDINRDNKVEQMIVPRHDNYRGRIIRLHEMIHAQRSQFIDLGKTMIEQAIEDCYVHTHYWPTLSETTKEEAAQVAVEDAENLGGNAYQYFQQQQYNRNVVEALRSLAIASECGTKADVSAVKKFVRKAFKGKSMVNKLLKILEQVKLHHRDKAKEMFRQLLLKAETDPSYISVPGMKSPGSTMPWGGATTGEFEEWEDGNEEDGATTEEFNNKDLMKLLGKPQNWHKGMPLPYGDHPMAVVELPRIEHCDAVDTFVGGSAPASNGQRLIVRRFAHTVATGNLFGLFRHRFKIKKYHGTCLIDASGSMGMENSTLKKLCTSASFLQVAYYSGFTGNLGGAFGTLCIYSKDGKRANEILYRNGANEVDLFALRWLLLQQPPLYLVTDLGYCGGPHPQAVEGLKLYHENKDRLTLFTTFGEALEFFKNKQLNKGT